MAELAGDLVPLEAQTVSAPTSLDDISGEDVSALPAILLGVICALIWLFAWLVGMRWRKWPAYGIALPFFMVCLFFFFEDFSRLLPSNF